MIMKCPNCDGALEYDVKSKKLLCKFCFSYFEPELFQEEEQKVEQKIGNWGMQLRDEADTTNESLENESEYMEAEIYSCTACGAELMINNVEAATFCAYCGQPTIVFNRVSKCRRPDSIIPFEVTKDVALSKIREKINKGFFVPNEIKNFKVEMLRGIYIPFWLYDVDYKDRVVVKGTVGSGKNSRTEYFYRKASCHLSNLSLDASKRFNDESSIRLEPYYFHATLPFQADYLSGFYADCGDDNKEKMDRLAIDRTRNLFDNEVVNTVKARDKKIIRSTPQYAIQKRPEYALLPAWFLVFREQQTFYTIMVNGQTGKVIGAVPSDKKRERLAFALLAIALGLIGGFLGSALIGSGEEESFKALIMVIVMACAAFGAGGRVRKSYEQSQKLTTESDIKEMVAERQDGE